MLKPKEVNKMLVEWMSDPRICHLFKWKEATTGNFCMVNCLVLSWCELHLLHLDFIDETQSIKALILNTLAALEPGVDILNYQPDLGHWAQMFSLSEPVQAEVQGDGGAVSNCWQVKRNVPKGIDCCRNTLTHLHVKLIEENMEIFLKTWQTTSDWSLPVNIVSTIQVQEEGTMPGGLILQLNENILDNQNQKNKNPKNPNNLFCRWDAGAADPEWQWKTHGHPDIIMKRLTKDYEKEVKKYPMNDKFIFLPYINLLLVAGKMMCMGPDHVEKLCSVRAVQVMSSFEWNYRINSWHIFYIYYLVWWKGRFVTRVELLKKLCNFTHNTLILLRILFLTLSENAKWQPDWQGIDAYQRESSP